MPVGTFLVSATRARGFNILPLPETVTNTTVPSSSPNIRIGWREFMTSLTACLRSIDDPVYRVNKSTLANAIVNIIKLRPYKKMPRIYARWIVATMADISVLWNWANIKHETAPVSQPPLSFSWFTKFYESVAMASALSSPNPAFSRIGDFNLFPKAFFKSRHRGGHPCLSCR